MRGIKIGGVVFGLMGARIVGGAVSQAFGFAIYVQKSSPWWIGDLIVMSLERWGDDAYEVLGVPPHLVDAVERWRAVAAKVPREIRRADVGWSHHAAVANLPVPQQRYILAQAADGLLNLKEVQELAKQQRAQNREANR